MTKMIILVPFSASSIVFFLKEIVQLFLIAKYFILIISYVVYQVKVLKLSSILNHYQSIKRMVL